MPSGGTYTTIDDYLATLEPRQRATLQSLRETIRSIIPDVDECISYAMPAFRVDGTVVAGFAAFKNHLTYVPHSGSVLSALGDELAAYPGSTKSALHFAVDQPPPRPVVEKLIAVRLAQARDRSRQR